jgi:hypothetical protein
MNNVEVDKRRQLGESTVCFSTDDTLATACPSFDKDRLTPEPCRRGLDIDEGPNRVLFTWPMRKLCATDILTFALLSSYECCESHFEDEPREPFCGSDHLPARSTGILAPRLIRGHAFPYYFYSALHRPR